MILGRNLISANGLTFQYNPNKLEAMQKVKLMNEIASVNAVSHPEMLFDIKTDFDPETDAQVLALIK